MLLFLISDHKELHFIFFEWIQKRKENAIMSVKS